MDGFDWTAQEDFSAGAFPLQERVPASAVEDCVNGLYADDGSLYRRGGGAIKTADAPATLLSVWDVVLGGGPRTLASSGTGLYRINAADSGWDADLVASVSGGIGMRPAVVGGILCVPIVDGGNGKVLLYGGSRLPAAALINTDNVTVLLGSRDVAGLGAADFTGADPGMLLHVDPDQGVQVISKEVSSTQLQLAVPWQAPDAVLRPYTLKQQQIVVPGILNADSAPIVAPVANRLLAATGSAVAFSSPLQPGAFGSTDFHMLPDAATVLGIQAFGTSALVFTTAGIYEIENMAYDLTDAAGNAQQQIVPVAHDVVLWQETGLAGVDGGVLIPATDDLYVMSSSGLDRFHAPGMRKQWRAYVKAGYALGNAAVIRGHYFLPIIDTSAVGGGGHTKNYARPGYRLADVLVVRLDTGAWSRMSGHSAGLSFAKRSDGSDERLLTVNAKKVLDVSGVLDPAAANKNDGDGSTHQLKVTLTVQRRTPGDLLRTFRVRAELDADAGDTPSLTAEVAVGRPGSAFTTLAGSMPANTGQSPYSWTKINKRGQEVRVRLTSVGPAAGLVLRSVEYAFRASGRP